MVVQLDSYNIEFFVWQIMDACISSIARILSCNNVIGKIRVTFVSGNEHYLGSSENKASIFFKALFSLLLK